MNETQRVVVSGIGLVTPLGFDEGSVCEALFSGRSGIRRMTLLDPAPYRSQSAAEVDSAALAAALAARSWRPGDRTTDMALLASQQALGQGDLLLAGPGTPADDTAVLFGTGSGPSHALQDCWQTFFEKGGRFVRPTTVPRCMLNVVGSQVSIQFGLRGSNYVLVAACSSSTIALGLAFRTLRHGYARRVLVGGSDSMFTPGLYASWDNLGVMSRDPVPDHACRPFAADRTGFVLGEGAGAIVLETLDSARARGVRIRAEILGYGESSDATHITRPSVDGQAACMAAALQSADLAPQAIDFISAHGTATQANDVCETAAIRRVLGTVADSAPTIASKSYLGHSLGASGIIETIAAILCMEHGRLHANLNLDRPDPACDLRLDGADSLDVPLRICMKNSFGFGGSNATLIVGQFVEE